MGSGQVRRRCSAAARGPDDHGQGAGGSPPGSRDANQASPGQVEASGAAPRRWTESPDLGPARIRTAGGATGSAGVYGQGSVAFRWQGHGIDLSATDPEIEINGAASRAIFRFKGSGGTAYPDQRAVLLSLDQSGQPTISNGGKTVTYSLMRGTLTADGVNVFAGFYTPPDNDEFGCVSVAFTTP
ncbi:MAG: HtaA domain-containing protein [Thermoleophilia bacterium]|nr:HtaA domain-containing protein [Thermoleophilia bacterium]